MRFAISLLCLFPMMAVAEELPDDCSFDQVHLVGQLQALAKRIPGGRVDVADHFVEWHLPEGEVVHAGQGGCYDLGTRVSIRFAKGRIPPREAALKKLLKAVSTYWSKPEAQELSAALAQSDDKIELSGTGDFELQVPASKAFFQGFTILMSGDEISVSWISG